MTEKNNRSDVSNYNMEFTSHEIFRAIELAPHCLLLHLKVFRSDPRSIPPNVEINIFVIKFISIGEI